MGANGGVLEEPRMRFSLSSDSCKRRNLDSSQIIYLNLLVYLRKRMGIGGKSHGQQRRWYCRMFCLVEKKYSG